MMGRMGLSVTMITFNEEEEVQDALESVAWADEIVVVDANSTDRTVEICQKYTSRVYCQEWLGFSSQKNFALDRATNEWVLSLDADERVPPPLREEIQALLKRGPDCDGYSLARKNYFLGRWIRHCGWYPDYTMRLFNKKKGRFEERMVHEAVRISGKTSSLQNPLVHYTYKTLGEYIERMDRYSSLGAREMARRGGRCKISDLLLRPPFTFFRMYLLQQGFREGVYGLILSSLYAYYTFVKYAKLWEIHQRNSCR